MKWFSKSSLTLFIVLLLGPFSQLLGEELVGHILEVDETKGSFVLQPVDSREAVIVQLPDELLFLRPGGNRIPHCVHAENQVHVWGEYTGEDGVFVAGAIRPGNWQRDPTGVRSRLGHGCRKQGCRRSGGSR